MGRLAILVALLVVGLAAPVAAATVRLDEDGTRLFDAGYRTLARLEGKERVVDAQYRTLGWIRPRGEGYVVEDAGYRTLGRLERRKVSRSSGCGAEWVVRDRGQRLVARVDDRGRVTDASNRTVVTLDTCSPVGAALLLFFSD